MPTSSDTLLRRLKQAGSQSPGDPKFVGIDDWALGKEQRYGTIVVDLEGRKPLQAVNGYLALF